MDAEDTQLIDDSPREHSTSRSIVLGELSGSDGALHEPTQLLYTQLLDQYEGRRMNDGNKTRHLEMDMQTQIVDDYNFDAFRKHEGLAIPSEDEASKETQLVHVGEAHSGSSSGKDGEVDSALSPIGRAFRGNASHWLSEFSQRDRSIQGVAGRSSQTTFPYRGRYLGETQILSDDENGGAHDDVAKYQRNFAETRAGVDGCPEVLNRDGDLPHFLRDFESNRRDYGGQRMVGSWNEVVGQSDGCNEDDRGWDSAVKGLGLVDSDASTEDDKNNNESVFNADVSFTGDARLSQNVCPRLSTRVSSNFCSQDLNKSPEPETMMDEWGEGNGIDLERGGINEGGSNLGILDRLQQSELGCPSQSAPIIRDRYTEALNGRITRASPPPSRTAGSIRTESLRASALRASSCSSSGKYCHSTPQGSKGEEVHKSEPEAMIEMNNDVPAKSGRSPNCNPAISRLSMERRGPSFAASLPSANLSDREEDFPRMANEGFDVEKVFSTLDNGAGSKVDACRHGEASSPVLEPEGCEPVEKTTNSSRKLFSEDDKDMDKEIRYNAAKHVGVQSLPSFDRVDGRRNVEVEPLPPRENRSSPAEDSLERRTSFGSGFFSTGGDMSYLNLQSPGEDSQARALNMVDKLVWLNAIGVPQEPQLEEEKVPARGPLHSKNVLQSRVQVAEAKAGMDDPFGVFDWVDSQNDEAAVMLGSGRTKSHAGKGTSKLAVMSGQHPKQVGPGFKKGGLLDVAGARNRKAEKLSEQEKVTKPMPNTDKQKVLASKSLSLVAEKKREKHEGRFGRDLNRTPATENRQEPGQTEPAHCLGESHEGRLGNLPEKQLGSSDKSLKKLGAIDSTFAVDKVPHGPTAKASYHQISTNPEEQAKFERSSNSRGPEHIEGTTKFSSLDSKTLDVQTGRDARKEAGEAASLLNYRQAPAQGQPSIGTRSLHDVNANGVIEAPERNVNHNLQETADKMEEGDGMQDVGDVELSHQVLRENFIQISESGLEAVPTISNCSEKTGLSVMLQGESDNKLASHLRPGDVGLDLTAPQQKSYGDAEEKHAWPGEMENVEHIQDGSRLQLIVDFNSVRETATLESANILLQDQSVTMLPIVKDFHVGPDTQAAGEAMELMKNTITPINGKRPVIEDKHENVAVMSDTSPLENDIADDRQWNFGGDVQFASERGHMATRRSRSQSRHIAKAPENADPPGGVISSTMREKGRGRRVTWAGSLEQVPGQRAVVRRGRSLRQHSGSREADVDNSAADSSGQDEEAEDMKEATSKENGSRKRNSEVLEMVCSRDDDLDRIKRRFNMSDAEVARLLGTDEEEDAEVNQTMSVKVRSLSRIQPGAEENEVAAPLSFRKVGKGLRSARIRNEEGGRRIRPFTTLDQRRLDGDELVMSYDQNVVGQCNIEGMVMMETHPSDNEVASGRRRMRSIADVSSPFFQQTTPGKPPLARGWRRRRARRPVKSPTEFREDASDAELSDLPPSIPSVSIVNGVQGKGGLRSARKRKEPECETVPSPSEVSMSPNSSKEASPTGFKQRKRSGAACVLLSHGLNEHTLKQQRKILTRLGGKVATSASECSHFVADKFVRTGNMLEAMAAGTPVVTARWLETCSEANHFVDEQEFILEDTKKEDEMGFSMISTLAAARQRPLLQGIRVYVTPGTSPGPESLARIVRAAGGQVVNEYIGPAPNGDQESDFCVILSSEEEFDVCISLLEKGAKVYTPELLLSGVTSYHLDFSNDQLFRNFTRRRRRGSLTRRTTL